MNSINMTSRIVRYGELVPCRSAFIDTHTPGSNQKENFTIIGGGVSESPDQHVHIRETPGFNIGAAGQPPNCRNSLHSHRTAEVFIVFKGRWRFFWGRWGSAGEVVLEEGDVFNIPTGIFRGFENIGQTHGMLLAILGGDDAGGGVIWAPQVIEEAQQHGLILAETGRLYDTNKGESLPGGVKMMPVLSDRELENFPETPVQDIIPRFVARYCDISALAVGSSARVIGHSALIVDRPGFEVDFVNRQSLSGEYYTTPSHEILMATEGHWRLAWDSPGIFPNTGQTVLAPGDTVAVPPRVCHSIAPAVSGECGLFRVRNTDDTAGPTRNI